MPIAVTAVSGATLEKSAVQNTAELQNITPGLNIQAWENGLSIQPRIRGIGASTNGPGIENCVATYIDGVYVASSTASLLTLTNIDRVEVLQGPQGTLFGRNATGGLINVITKDPTDHLSGLLDASFGNHDAGAVEAYIAGPLSNSLRADLGIEFATQGRDYGSTGAFALALLPRIYGVKAG